MRNKRPPKNHRKRHRVWLYSAVYTGRFSVIAIFLLLGSFFVQPFHQAFAAESGEVAEEPPASVAADVKPQEPIEEQEPAPETIESDVVVDAPLDEESIEDVEQVEGFALPTTDMSDTDERIEISAATSSTSESAVPQASDGGVANDGSATTSTQGEEVTATSSTSSAAENQASTTPESSTGTAGGNESASPANDVAGDTASEEESAPVDTPTTVDEVGETETRETSGGGSTNADEDEDVSTETDVTEQNLEEQSDTVVQVASVSNNENYYQFSKQSCVAVGDGTYHCTQRDASDVDPDSAVYAELGASGNLEIFMRTSKGATKQLTDNNRDDTAPHYDPESMQIVWQRMVDSRYQIILYDLNTQEETQLTFSRTNNMEPKVSPDGIVWQAWDGNDWEIMYFDGTYTDQITDNSTQDVTPVIQDGYVVWSVLGGESNLARVYSISTGEVMSITGHEGGTIANPRFVLVYDTQFENGDIITQGFDPETGMAKPISAQPGPEPVNIPSTDPVGETIALIQNKSSSKDDKNGVIIKTDGQPDLDVSSSSASTTVTLNLIAEQQNTQASSSPEMDSDVATSSVDGTQSDFILDEFDLVIVQTPNEGIVSTSTPEEVPMMDREVVDAEVAATSSQSTSR